MYSLSVETHIDAAHYIADYQGKCSREHGHRWTVKVTLEGEELDSMNMLVDFAVIKAILKSEIERTLDHYQLNDVLDERNVTAEHLSKWIFGKLKNMIPTYVKLSLVTVNESPECSVSYDGRS